MDMGTVNRVNEIARLGPLVPKKIPIYYNGYEVGDTIGDDEPLERVPERSVRFVVDSGHDMPDPTYSMQSLLRSESLENINADDVRASDDTGVETIEQEPVVGDEIVADVEIGGAEPPEETEIRGDDPIRDEEPARDTIIQQADGRDEIGGAADDNPRYNYPILEEPSRYNVVGAPWHMHGRPLMPGSSRSDRVRRQPERYSPDALMASADIIEEVYQVVETAFKRQPSPLANRRSYRPSMGMSRVKYARAEASREKHRSAYIMTVGEALDQFGADAVESLSKELTSLHAKKVFKQVLLRDLSKKQIKRIIRSKMFLKQKYKADGVFDKLKSRYVAGGHMQRRDEYSEGETSSPTVGLQSVYMVVSIAAREKRKVGSMDVGTAYLNATMMKEVIMRIEPKLAELLVKMFPGEYELDSDGCIYVVLEKALYGCLESAKLWYDEIVKTLTGMGFVANDKDPCVFNTMRDGHQVTVCLYVDDVLVTSINESDIDWVYECLTSKYGTVSITKGDLHSYLGQSFDFSNDGKVVVSMEGYVRDMLDLYKVTGYRVTPAADDLYEVDDTLLTYSAEGLHEFHSRVMKLMFLALRARPDILTPVAFLSKRVTKATAQDGEKLSRVLMYLNSCPELAMTICNETDMRVYAYVDASFAVHGDMKSQTGCIISMGSGSVHVSSKGQALMTKSSTESELVAVSDALPQILWTKQFLESQGYQPGPVRVYQDNQSTMALIEKGRSTSSRTRHIAIRYFFVSDKVSSGEVEIVYLPTGSMRADIMTKPLQGDLFRKMRAELMGHQWISIDDGGADGTAPGEQALFCEEDWPSTGTRGAQKIGVFGIRC
jgi:hypothetical protein